MRLSTFSKVLLLFGIIFCVIPEAAYAEFDSERVQGSLESSDVRTSDGSPYQRLEFRGEAGQQITIELTSSDFDAYLILQDSNGRNIAVDDDGGSNGNDARLVVTLPSSGRYQALVTTYHPSGRGVYTLTVAETGAVSSSHISSSSHIEVPSSSSPSTSCTEAISAVEDHLAEGGYYIPWENSVTSSTPKQIYPEVILDGNFIPNSYYGYPDERTQTVSFRLSGDVSKIYEGIMNSPQLMTSYSSQIINACNQVGLVEFRHWYEGRVFAGYFPNGSVRLFEWAPYSAFSPWGYYFSP
jgi:hypothetical protein